MALQVRLLGPVDASIDGRAIDLGGPRQRVLLAALAVEAGVFVSADRLIDRVWAGSELPANPRGALRTYLTRLRQSLGVDGLVLTSASGWCLNADRIEIDVARFEALVERADDVAQGVHERLSLLEEALRLWRGKSTGGRSR